MMQQNAVVKATTSVGTTTVEQADSKWTLRGAYRQTNLIPTASIHPYTLSDDCFLPVAKDTVQPFRAYMQFFPSGEAVDVPLSIRTADDDDAVRAPYALPPDALLYDLNGRRITKPTRGIIITNGSKKQSIRHLGRVIGCDGR